MPARTRRSDRFLRALEGYRAVVSVTHNTPDPDGIASGWAVCVLARERLGIPTRLIGGGAIVRAENLQMVKLLEPPLELVDSYRPPEGAAIVLVDCSPEGGNQIFAGRDVRPVAVIDHHASHDPSYRVKFRDLRPKASATAAIVSGYLREQKVEPSPELATALVYAIRTEIVGTPVRFSRSERGLLSWLGEWVDQQKLSDIAKAPLSRRYFEDLCLALTSTFLWGDVAFGVLPDAGSAEIVGEVADLLIRMDGVSRVLFGANLSDGVVVSARSKASSGSVVPLLGAALQGLGSWGGHRHRAGGRIAATPEHPVSQAVVEEVKDRWLKACGADGRGCRLVARKELMELL